MTLRLSVVSEHGIRLGDHATKVFGIHGGSIGRGSDNAWILPDPERYLSGKHARIDFRKGSYVLVDTSSNGTYVNGAQVPLGKYHDYTLKDGDYVRLGEYELLVSIDAGNAFSPAEEAAITHGGQPPSPAAYPQAIDNDLGADLDLSVLLEANTHGDSTIQARNSYGQFVRPDWDKPAAAEPPPRSTQTGSFSTGTFSTGTFPPGADVSAIPISHTGTFRNPALRPSPPAAVPDPQVAAAEPAAPWHMMTRPLRLDPRSANAETPTPATPEYPVAPVARAFAPSATGSVTPARGPVPLIDGDLEVGLTAFCRGAGIDPRTISGEARGIALQLAGQLLRESLSGLLDLTQAQGELRARFRIPAPQDERYESPLNFSRGVEEALVRLISNSSTRASSVDAIRENFKDLKAQNAAFVTAMRAAFEAFVERLEPATLEERFEGAAKRGVFGTPNKARYWEMYAEMFAGLAQRSSDGFPHVFSESFAKHFEIIHRSLNPPRRSAFGADRHDPAEPGDKVVGDY